MTGTSPSVDTTLKIGKGGLDKIVDEADVQLKINKELKIKVNRNIIEGRKNEFTRGLAETLAKKIGAEIVWVKGRTFVLKRD